MMSIHVQSLWLPQTSYGMLHVRNFHTQLHDHNGKIVAIVRQQSPTSYGLIAVVSCVLRTIPIINLTSDQLYVASDKVWENLPLKPIITRTTVTSNSNTVWTYFFIFLLSYLRHLWPFRTICDHFRPFPTICNHFQPVSTIYLCLRLVDIIYVFLQTISTACVDLPLFTTIYDNLWPFAIVCHMTVCHHLRLFVTVCDHLRPFTTACDRLRSLWP